ncbi:MAG: hypothetical protein NT016_01485 [Candidatus Aenigmarchaeota archaeon]|nr:hypothetical protein [Candidatus Aenigmarchaeota archaeon]
MGQRGGECVGCEKGDIEEFKRLSEYLFRLKHGTVMNSKFPKVSPDNRITSVIEYLDECPFPVMTKRIRKYFSETEKNAYNTASAVEYAVLSKDVEVIYGSKTKRYQLTPHGREMAELLMAVKVGVFPITSAQSDPYQAPEARLPALSSSPRPRRA